MRNFLFWFAVSITAGVVLLNVEYGIFQNEEKLTPVVEATSKSQHQYDATPRTSQKTKTQYVYPAQRLKSNRLREALQLALNIQMPSNRDSALQELVYEAFEVNDLLLAIEITNSISRPSTRDKTYTQIIERTLLMSDFKTAGIAAKKISRPSTRDSHLQKILRASVENE